MKTFAAILMAVVIGCCYAKACQANDGGAPPDPTPVIIVPLKPTYSPLFVPLTPAPPSEASSKQPVDCGRQNFCVPTYRFVGEVDEESVQDAIAWLNKAKALVPAAIVIELTTRGGRTDHGFEMARTMEQLDVPVYCVAEYEVKSEGFAILQACKHRYMTPRTTLMTHKPFMVGVDPVLTLEDAENYVARLRSLARAHAQYCSKRMKISLAEYEARLVGKQDWNLDSTEALRVGAIDQIVSSVRDVRDTLRLTGQME